MIKVRFVWVALVLFCQLPSANADTYTPGQPVDASYQEFAAQFINRPVSYTHLTLPTKA